MSVILENTFLTDHWFRLQENAGRIFPLLNLIAESNESDLTELLQYTPNP
jgi:hypothetical protein